MAADESAADRAPDSRFRALLVDYGGVLTSGMPDAMGDFCSAHDVERSSLDEVLRGLAGDGVTLGEIQDLETGAISVAEFERVLAGRLRTRGGDPLEAPGLVRRLFAGFRRETAMVGAVRRAREHGLRTALLSNSWGSTSIRAGTGTSFSTRWSSPARYGCASRNRRSTC